MQNTTGLVYRHCMILTQVSAPVSAIYSCSLSVSYFISFQKLLALFLLEVEWTCLGGGFIMT